MRALTPPKYLSHTFKCEVVILKSVAKYMADEMKINATSQIVRDIKNK
jgi:hypothetical protein